jgi:hypothetical protein
VSEARDFGEPRRPSPPIGVFLILSRFQRGDYLTTGESPLDMLAQAWRLLYGTDPSPEATVDEIVAEIQLAIGAYPTPGEGATPPEPEAPEGPEGPEGPEAIPDPPRRARFAAEAAGILTPTGSRDDDSPATAGDLCRLYAQIAADHVQIMGHVTESGRATVQTMAEGFVEADHHPRRMHPADREWLLRMIFVSALVVVIALADDDLTQWSAFVVALWLLWSERIGAWWKGRRTPAAKEGGSDAPS